MAPYLATGMLNKLLWLQEVWHNTILLIILGSSMFEEIIFYNY